MLIEISVYFQTDANVESKPWDIFLKILIIF